MNPVDPQPWRSDELARLADHPTSRIDELIPWRWKGEGGRIRYRGGGVNSV